MCLALTAPTAWADDPIGSSKTAVQVADLYIQAMTGDVEKAKAINAYLRPAFDGKDALDIAVIKDLPNRLKERMASGLKAHVGNSDAALDQAISAFAASNVKAILRSPCHATGSTYSPNEYRRGEPIAEVTYECRVPDVASIIGRLQDIEDARPTAATVRKMSAAFDATPADRPIHGTFHLYSNPRRHVWETGDPCEVLSAVVDAIGGSDPQ
jgi:hypothetical protein